MSLEKFVSTIKGKSGLARTNRFTVEFGLPSLMQKDKHDLRSLFLLCESVSLPSMNIATQGSRTFGEQREIPYDRNFESLNMTFYVDKNMEVKDFFNSWMHAIINPVSRTISYYDNYTTSLLVTVYDLKDKAVYDVGIYEAYPKSVGQIQLDNNSKDIMKLNVTFNYKYHLGARIDTVSGEPEIMNQYKLKQYEGLNGFIPNNYFNAGSALSSTVPEEYLVNFNTFQERYIDSVAMNNALSKLNSQGIDTGIAQQFVW